MAKIAKLELDGKTHELPIIVGSEGEQAIDVSELRAKTLHITIDNGYVNTGACTSDITFLDGEEGILRYRGYPIEQLAEKSNFLEVSYLLIYGHLPTQEELKGFADRIKSYGQIPTKLKESLLLFPTDAHPMGVLSASVAALSAYYPKMLVTDEFLKEKDQGMAQIMNQMKILSAYFYRHSKALSLVDSKSGLDYVADFAQMMFHREGKAIDPEIIHALDVLFILHADHEQNCSTSTVRMVGSSQANLYASIASGINALWGPSHGGANQAVIEMLEQIQKDGGGHQKFLAKAKDKNDPFRLMGFGHRVYKNFDPRAKIIKKICDNVLNKLGINDPALEVAKGLEEAALRDSYFIERKLYPNVDFYSGIIFRAIGIPTNMFTVMFALGRLPGWLAQWKELVESSQFKIGRPRQIYTGASQRDFVPMNLRGK